MPIDALPSMAVPSSSVAASRSGEADLRFVADDGDLTKTVVQTWVRRRQRSMIDAWLTQGKRHKTLAHDAWSEAVRTGWLDGAQRLWESRWGDPATMIERAWPLVMNARPGSTSTVDPQPLEAFLTDLTWGEPISPSHAKAQHHARIAALSAATLHLHEQRWHAFLDRGVDVTQAGGRNLLTSLLCQRFGVGPCGTGWTQPNAEQAQALDRCMDRLVDAKVPFPNFTPQLVGLANDPELGAAAKRHLLNWVPNLRHPGRLDKAITMALHGLVTHTMRPNPDPMFLDALFQAWIDQGVTPTVTIRPQDLKSKRGLDVPFQNGYLTVSYDPHRSASGPNEDLTTYRAGFARAVWKSIPSDQTFNVAEHWFAREVPGFQSSITPLTEAQRDTCVARWRQREETPQLRALMDVPTGPSRPRSRL